MSDEPPKAIGRAKSCVNCRQVKLRCDARRTWPQPCSRCKKDKIECRFDANFQRHSTRKLAKEISNELHSLRSTEHANSTSSGRKLSATSTAHSAQQIIPVLHSSSHPAVRSPLHEWFTKTPGDTNRWLTVSSDDITSSYELEKGFVLEFQIVVELFELFEAQYQQHCPFLQPVVSLRSLLEKSSLLFWTIILVTAQNHDRYAALYERIVSGHAAMLSGVTNRAIQKIETIHALLILSLWPITRSRQSYDPSWNYIGLATSAAMQLHCHDPIAESNEASAWKGFGDLAPKDMPHATQILTWLACFQVGTSIANFLGILPPMSTSQTKAIDQACDGTIPHFDPPYEALLLVIKISALSTNTLVDIEDPDVHFSLTRMFEAQLEELKHRYQQTWTTILEVELQTAKLYLFGMTFTLADPSNTAQVLQAQTYRETSLHKALQAACGVIKHMTALSQTPVTSGYYPSGVLTVMPKKYFTGLFVASTFCFRFLASNVSRTPAQEGMATEALIEAHKVFQSFPAHRDIIRAAIHIEAFMSVVRDIAQGKMKPLDNLTIRNKLGASLYLDSVFESSRQRNRNPTSGASPPVEGWKMMNVINADRLAKAPVEDSEAENEFDRETSTRLAELETLQQPTQMQDASWWAVWDSHMDAFEVGMEELTDWDKPVPGSEEPSDSAVAF